MTKFIRLTETNANASKLLLNIEHIGSIQSGNNKDCYVRMSYNKIGRDGVKQSEYYFVKESFEEIEAMLIGAK